MRWGSSNGWVPLIGTGPCALRRRFLQAHCGERVDVDGVSALGVVVNVPLSNGLQIEGPSRGSKCRFANPRPEPDFK